MICLLESGRIFESSFSYEEVTTASVSILPCRFVFVWYCYQLRRDCFVFADSIASFKFSNYQLISILITNLSIELWSVTWLSADVSTRWLLFSSGVIFPWRSDIWISAVEWVAIIPFKYWLMGLILVWSPTVYVYNSNFQVQLPVVQCHFSRHIQSGWPSNILVDWISASPSVGQNRPCPTVWCTWTIPSTSSHLTLIESDVLNCLRLGRVSASFFLLSGKIFKNEFCLGTSSLRVDLRAARAVNPNFTVSFCFIFVVIFISVCVWVCVYVRVCVSNQKCVSVRVC